MLKIIIEVVHAALGVIYTIQGPRRQGALCSLKLALIASLHKIKHLGKTSERYGQYICTNAKQVLLSNIRFSLPKRMGEYFIIPDSSFTDIRQKISHSK